MIRACIALAAVALHSVLCVLCSAAITAAIAVLHNPGLVLAVMLTAIAGLCVLIVRLVRETGLRVVLSRPVAT